MEYLNYCPCCNASIFKPFIKCVDFLVSRETFQIVQCTVCNFKFTNPRPNQNEIGRYYESTDYVSHSNSKKGLFNLTYQLIRKIAIKGKLKLIESLSSNQRQLLDIGCGTGEFLKKANEAGWKTVGLEPSNGARDYAKNKYQLSVFDLDYFNQIENRSFDVITMWHVLEHVPNLHEFIERLKSILKDSGTIIIAVPNSEAFEAGLYKEIWAAYDVPRHLNHFSQETMHKVLNFNQLKINRKIAMPFDAFYISMLSEKYNGSGFLKMVFKGIFVGLYSYFKSKSSINLASSIIYVITKS